MAPRDTRTIICEDIGNCGGALLHGKQNSKDFCDGARDILQANYSSVPR